MEENKEGNEKKERTIEESFALLDQMVASLEKSDVSLEDSFKLYQDGMKVLKECSDKIDTVEKKMLQMNKDGTVSEF